MSTRTATKPQSQAASHFSANASGLLQRQCACGNHTVAGGECAECRKKREGMLQRATVNVTPVNGVPPIVHDALRLPGQLPDAATRAFMEPRFGRDFSRIPTHSPAVGAMQTKLAINKPGDEYEQEADRIADQVLAAPAHSVVSGAYPHIQRFVGQSTGETELAPASVDRVLASSGRPLDPALQQDMGQRFGHDFSRVRVHSGAAAEQSARDVNAHAYTMGHNIVFGTGQFAPGTQAGRRLIAHELTHTIQQSEVVTATSGRADPVGPLPFGISNVARPVSGLVQRSWTGDRIDWVRTATKENNWAGSNPPGAYYVLNGLSMDDMVRILRALTPAHRKKLSDNLDEHGAGFDRPRLHLALANAATAPGDTAFRERSENLHWAIRSKNYTNSPGGAFYQLVAAKKAKQLDRLLAALNRDALNALIAHRDEADAVLGGTDVLGASLLQTTAKKAATSDSSSSTQTLCFAISELVSGLTPGPRLFGAIAELIINRDYCKLMGCKPFLVARSAGTDYFDNLMGAIIYIAFLGDHNKLSESEIAQIAVASLFSLNRPDILSHKKNRKDYYEIKPNSISGRAAGRLKLRKLASFYEGLLPYTPGTAYTPTPEILLSSGHFGPFPLEVFLRVQRLQDGLVVYDICVRGELLKIGLTTIISMLIALIIFIIRNGKIEIPIPLPIPSPELPSPSPVPSPIPKPVPQPVPVPA